MSSDVIPISFGKLRRRSLRSKARRAAATVQMATVQTATRLCRKEDLARVAEIHKSQFLVPGALLGNLSPALIAAFYAAFLDRSIFLVHTSDAEIDGFVLGGSSRAMISCKNSFIRKHALLCIADVVRRPRLLLRVFRALAKLFEGWLSSSARASPRDEFRMLSIAVARRATRKGVGRALVQGFEAAIGAACDTYRLNVSKTNTPAIRFYEKLGFQCAGETATSRTLRKDMAAMASELGTAIPDAEILPLKLKLPCVSRRAARGVDHGAPSVGNSRHRHAACGRFGYPGADHEVCSRFPRDSLCGSSALSMVNNHQRILFFFRDLGCRSK